MADENEVVEETPIVAPVGDAEDVALVEEPHPLSPGGKRFEEVYGDWRTEQARAQRAEADLAALRSQRQPQPPVQYTSDQVATYLQTQVDQGAITPMAAANALSQFNARAEATKTAIQVEQYRAQANKLQAAGVEVNQYIDRIPALKDTSSADFKRISDAAHSVSDDMGLPVTDLRVQRRALREVYGTLDKVAQSAEGREQSRRASVPHVETTTGSTRVNAPVKGDDAWKKDVPERYFAFWKERGYSEQRMKDEAKYIKPRAAK